MARTTKIPRFKTYEEEAEFWDTHSPEDFPDEFEEIQVQFAPPEVLDSERRKRLVETLAGLPDAERQMLAMALLGLAPDEIADVMGWKRSDLEMALRRLTEHTWVNKE